MQKMNYRFKQRQDDGRRLTSSHIVDKNDGYDRFSYPQIINRPSFGRAEGMAREYLCDILEGDDAYGKNVRLPLQDEAR